MFIADSLGLDFLNSIATPVDTPVDWIGSGDGLLNWLAQAKLVPVDALNELKARAMPGELDKVADQARALREWFSGFVRKHMGRPLDAQGVSELGPLNKLLERDETFSQIVRHRHGDGDRLELHNDAALAIAGSTAAADRRNVGEVCMRRRLRRRQSVRGTGLHPDVRRPYAQARATMVQHGDLRQSRQTGRAPQPAQEQATDKFGPGRNKQE